MRWDVGLVLAGHPELAGDRFGDTDLNAAAESGLPENLVLAKARKLIKRGLLDGCACGCRGDFELSAPGRDALCA